MLPSARGGVPLDPNSNPFLDDREGRGARSLPMGPSEQGDRSGVTWPRRPGSPRAPGRGAQPTAHRGEVLQSTGRRQPLLESRDGRLGLRSGTLGLELWAEGGKMRFRDLETGLDLLGHDEEHDRAEREATARSRGAAEARVAELEALLAGKRG